MEYIKRYMISISISFILVLVFCFLLNVLNYFDVLNKSFYKGLLILFLVISIFIGSYNLGYKSENKGYLNGIIFGFVISVLFIVLSLVLKSDLSLSSAIYYLIIVITSSIGGTIGINKKITETNQ